MARTFVAASSQYLVQAAAPVTSTPLTLATWIRVANTAAPFKAALSVCSGAGSDHATLYCEGSNLRAQARGGAAGTGATVSGLSAGTWQHAAGVYASSTSKIAYLNGTAGSTETTSYTFGTLDRVAVGVAIQTTPTGEYFDGDIAESAIWNVALTADEIAALAKGFNPRFIRPASLVAYWPITGNDSPELDRWKSRYDLTLNGTPAKADHPRMLARSRAQAGYIVVAPLTPNTPAPADASTRQSRTPTFTWAASGATSYDVYFGTAASPPLVSSGQAGASYTPAGPLSPTTTYYWKVVAINGAGSTTGPIWSFTTLNPFELLLRIAGVTPHMRIAGLNIRNLLNEAANTCSFTVDGTAPTVGQDVQIGLGSLASSDLLFAGTIENVDQIYQGGKAVNLAWLVRCQDYTRTLNRRKVRIRYGQQSATSIAIDLVSHYTTGFTTVGVVAALPTVTGGIDFTDEDVMACLRRLASRIGGYADVDYGKDVKLFLTDTSTPPDDLVLGLRSLINDDPPVTYAIDLSQVRTRVWVEGGGANAKAFIAAGGTTLPVDDATWYVTPGGAGIVVSGPQRIAYTGVVTGGAGALVGTTVTPTNGPTVTKRAGTGLTAGAVGWATTFKTAAGETLPGPVTTVVMGGAVDPPIAPSAVKQFGGSLSAGAYQWKLAHVDAGGNETLCGSASAIVTMDDVAAPSSIGQVEAEAFGGSSLDQNAIYGYKYIFSNGSVWTGPSSASTVNSGSDGSGHGHAIRLLKSSLSAPPSGYHRDFYRTDGGGSTYKKMPGANDGFDDDSGGYFRDVFQDDASLGATIPSATAIYRSALLTLPTTAPAGVVTLRIYRTAAGGSTFKKDGDVAIGTATYVSTIADGSLGTTELSVATSFYLAADLSNIPIGPATTTGRGNYRTIAGGATLKLQSSFANNTSTSLTDTTADGSLGATAPVTDTSGLTVQTGEVAAGSTSILVTSTAPFQAAGGWAFIGSLPIRYTGFSGTALTGVPPSGIGALTTTVRYAVEIVAAPMLIGIPPSGAGSILYDILSGDPVNLLVQCDDVAAQAALATMEGGDSDGIYEHTIQDRRLSFAEATATGNADLALFSRPIVTIHYASSDPKTRSGKTVHVNLPSLGLVGDWTIQSVTIDQIGIAANTYPRYTVDASSVRFSFESVLRLLALKVA